MPNCRRLRGKFYQIFEATRAHYAFLQKNDWRKRMLTKTKWIVFAASFFFGAALASPQAKRPAETRNGALRYWMAFAELQDPPADKATAELLEKTAAGEAPWDEAKL